VFADAELRQKYLLALLTRDAQVWHERTGIHAQWIGPDDVIERTKKVAVRRKLLRQRDERIRLGLRVKKFARPTGTWSSAERPDSFATSAACIVCGVPLDPVERPSGTCSRRCYNAVRQFKRTARNRATRAEHRMVNDSTGPQPSPDIRYSDPPAVQVPQKQTLTSDAPTGSGGELA
jgi:predicted nucleic acid-binding Zn ribbon protein